MDRNEALKRLRALVDELEHVLPGPDILSTTHVEDAARELVDAFGELERALTEGGPREVDHQTTAVTIAGVDVYVRDTPNAVIVSVGTDELPANKSAYVEAIDGMSWEHELP